MKFKIHKQITRILPIIVFSLITWAHSYKAQTCSSSANIQSNGSTTVNGIKVTSTSTGAVLNYPASSLSSCAGGVSIAGTSLMVGNNDANPEGIDNAPWKTTLNFSEPVNDLIVVIAGSGITNNEKFYFTPNNGTVSISSATNCFTTISGNSVFIGKGSVTTSGGGIFKITSTVPFTTLTMNGLGGSFGSLIALCSSSITTVCPAKAPILNNTTTYSSTLSTYAIPCGSKTADLSVLTASNMPSSGSIITWHTGSVATSANRIIPATAVLGTAKYYAAFYNASKNCYSPTKMVVVTAPICAVDDDYTAIPIIAGVGGILPSIFSNDTYNGTVISTMPANSVDFFYEVWNTSNATVDGSGNVSIPATTAAGNYTYYYRICDKDTDISASTNCSVAEVKFTVVANPSAVCYKPGVAGSALPVNHGITALGRVGANDKDNWPMVRNGAWTALESKTKGFVVNRLTTAQISAIPIANLTDGMMVYNVTLNCLQINTTGTPAGWSCLTTQTCPN